MPISTLPHLDVHATTAAADADDVWRSLLSHLDASFSRPGVGAYARLVGCDPSCSTGPRPLAEGSTVPGFRVTSAVVGRELVLEGRHRFSSYALVFRIEQTAPGRSVLRAESRAVFPGVAGGIYRLLVLRSGGHVAGVRRLLAGVRRRAE